MRPNLFLALALLLPAGCTSVQPAPQSARDGKTPIAPENPTISQRITGMRMRQAEVASGGMAVEGHLVR